MLTIVGLLAALFLVTFLLGSIPWGVIISKVFYHKDLRDEGSGNIGTTNAMRSMGKVGGGAVFVLDFGKGLVAGWVGTLFADMLSLAVVDAVSHGYTELLVLATPELDVAALAMALSFAGCTLGHVFSPWLGWKGGKGIAVAAACLVFVFSPVGFLLEIACFALGVAITRCVSVGSIAAAVLCPILGLYYYWGHWVSWLIILAVAAVVVWAHRENIGRLRAGTESKIGSKKKAEA